MNILYDDNDVIIINKCDVANKEDLHLLKLMVQKLNPSAKIIETSFSKIDYTEIVNTKMFDFENDNEDPKEPGRNVKNENRFFRFQN